MLFFTCVRVKINDLMKNYQPMFSVFLADFLVSLCFNFSSKKRFEKLN
jgi:hypothetical protein